MPPKRAPQPEPESFAEKIRSIGAPRRMGSSERRPVTNEDTGGKAGYHVEHWDGRRDAVVTPQTVHFAPFKEAGAND